MSEVGPLGSVQESTSSSSPHIRTSLPTDKSSMSQPASAGFRPTGSSPKVTTLDSEQVSSREQTCRPFDIVVFGASGSAGRFITEELALVVDKYYGLGSANQFVEAWRHQSATGSKHLEVRDANQFAQTLSRRRSVPRHVDSIRWAIAGRSASKLSDTLCAAELSTGIASLSTSVPVILADLNHDKSLRDMCSKTSLLINCAGPYSISGESVIKACIETKTNYLDLTHELTFMERIRRQYSEEAENAQIFVVNGCGFQSMSAEMGLNFTKQMADGQIDEVKIILNLSNTKALIKSNGSDTRSNTCGIVGFGMWNSLLVERASSGLSRSRLLDKPNSLTRSASEFSLDQRRPLIGRRDTEALVTDLVQVKNRDSNISWNGLFNGFNQCGRRFCLPIGNLTSDETQLIRAEMSAYQLRPQEHESQIGGWKPIRCTSFISMKTYSELLMLMVWMFLFNILVKYSPLRALMRAFPSFASLGLVNDANSNKLIDRDSLSHIKFSQTFVAYGVPGEGSGDPLERREKHSLRKHDQLLIARVVGPEPNHIATATFCVQAALAIILEKDHLPSAGGVLTPAVAFAETNIIYQLRKRNIKFEVLKKA